MYRNCSDEFIFKVTDYACFGNKKNNYASLNSISVKQLMTSAYMAPELFSNEGCYKNPTPASDIYSLGILAYEIILGLHPWECVSIRTLY